MNPLQVARDYAIEEGFNYIYHLDGSLEVFHPPGGARVCPDGRVVSESHPRLKEVLEKKIALAKAEEGQIEQDPSGGCTIKFSAEYCKMPMEVLAEVSDTILLAVLKVKRSHLSPQFLDWDTKFANHPGNFPLPAGQEYLVLLLLTAGQLWTTIRSAWPPKKEEYYRSHVGEIVNIDTKR
jgi:hypothetical protein